MFSVLNLFYEEDQQMIRLFVSQTGVYVFADSRDVGEAGTRPAKSCLVWTVVRRPMHTKIERIA